MSRRARIRKSLIRCLLLIVMLTACSAATQTEPPITPRPIVEAPGSPLEPAATPDSLDPIEGTLKKQLAANLGLEPGVISVTRNSEVQFTDSCMEVPMKDVKCGQVAVAGRIIVLQALGLQFEYHVRSDGALIQPATRALEWSRAGGTQGLCDYLTIFLSGEVYGSRCQADPDRAISTLADLLSRDELEQFQRWIREFGEVQLDASDPEGTVDGIESLLLFYGGGHRMPDQTEEQALLHWAQDVFQRMFP